MQKQEDEGAGKGTNGGPEQRKDQGNPCNSPKNDCGGRGKGRGGGIGKRDGTGGGKGRGGGGKGGRRK